MLDAIFVADIEGLEEKTLRVSYRIFCFFRVFPFIIFPGFRVYLF